jgi:hypothetical protein
LEKYVKNYKELIVVANQAFPAHVLESFAKNEPLRTTLFALQIVKLMALLPS